MKKTIILLKEDPYTTQEDILEIINHFNNPNNTIICHPLIKDVFNIEIDNESETELKLTDCRYL